MLILQDRNIPRSKILLPVHASEWRAASQAQPKNIFGHENQTRFCATARLNDGHIVWRGWFDDRDDFDQFIWAWASGTLQSDRFVQRLSMPWWNPDLREYPNLSYEFVTVAFIISGTTWPVPSDCIGVSGQPGEFIDAIAGGGSGAAIRNFSAQATGGSAGAWSRITSLALTPGSPTPITIQVGTGGASVVSAALNGNPGTDSYFNGATLALSSVGAKAGLGGIQSGAANTGPAGGAAASGVGTLKNSGGKAGNTSVNGAASGGAAAGGPNGNGGDGVAASSSTVGSNGGSVPSGAAGGTGVTGNSANAANGTEYDATHGIGPGSGGAANSAACSSGTGGKYGGASGAACIIGAAGNATSGAAGPGLIVVAYNPLVLAFRRMRQYLRR